MTGIFYDPRSRRLCGVHDRAEPGWRLVTHDLAASPHQCRRIMSEWLSPDDLRRVDWTTIPPRR